MAYFHTEAFRLMRYRCERCGFVEVIWNSRNGATPFTIDCAAPLSAMGTLAVRQLMGTLTVHRLQAFLRDLGTFLPLERACGGNAFHETWNLDVFARNHDPLPGERYFRDGIPEEARSIMRARIERIRDHFPITDEEDSMLIESVGGEYTADGDRPMIVTEEFAPGWPMLVVRGTDADALHSETEAGETRGRTRHEIP